ncbi:MAG: hypothetical protein HY776_05880 [Actinobacteria bacterium]|nr:hypothetical protein [Actinomycetota bacterium]
MNPPNLENIWNETLDKIKKQLNYPAFKTWFENTTPVDLNNNELTISVPNSFTKIY